MEFLLRALNAIPSAASNGYALTAFAITIIAWVIISWRVTRNQNLLRAIRAIPATDRALVLEREMHGYHLQGGISPEQFLKKKIYAYLLVAFALTCGTVITIVALAVMSVPIRKVTDRPPPVTSAFASAEKWLTLLDDAHDYSSAFDNMSKNFKAGHRKEEMTALFSQFLDKLGGTSERIRQTEDPILSPPGYPSGWYNNLVFRTKFRSDPRFIYEFVQLQAEGNDWKVSGIHLGLKNGNGEFVSYEPLVSAYPSQ